VKILLRIARCHGGPSYHIFVDASVIHGSAQVEIAAFRIEADEAVADELIRFKVAMEAYDHGGMDLAAFVDVAGAGAGEEECGYGVGIGEEAFAFHLLEQKESSFPSFFCSCVRSRS
jgi:hypothetical protein